VELGVIVLKKFLKIIISSCRVQPTVNRKGKALPRSVLGNA
jgi:hypothetical protein